MARGKEKVRAGFYIEKEVLEIADSLLPAANVRSRNEFVTKALKFYCGYLEFRKSRGLSAAVPVLRPHQHGTGYQEPPGPDGL